MKIFVTMIPANLVTNSLLSSILSFIRNPIQVSNFHQVSGLVTRSWWSSGLADFCFKL